MNLSTVNIQGIVDQAKKEAGVPTQERGNEMQKAVGERGNEEDASTQKQAGERDIVGELDVLAGRLRGMEEAPVGALNRKSGSDTLEELSKTYIFMNMLKKANGDGLRNADCGLQNSEIEKEASERIDMQRAYLEAFEKKAFYMSDRYPANTKTKDIEKAEKEEMRAGQRGALIGAGIGAGVGAGAGAVINRGNWKKRLAGAGLGALLPALLGAITGSAAGEIKQHGKRPSHLKPDFVISDKPPYIRGKNYLDKVIT